MRAEVCSVIFVGVRLKARWFVLNEAELEGYTLLLCFSFDYATRGCSLESVP